jgi:class 3 adenylate cyclase
MDSNFRLYDNEASMKRLDEYLGGVAGSYEEKDSLPSADALTYSNGFYANCAALFFDIRNSSTLPSKYKRPTLARIYRAFISETVAIVNAHPKARAVNIVGDCVWGTFNTPYKDDIDEIFRCAYRTNSLMKALRYKMEKHGMATPIYAGIGMAWGRALMIKAGYNGSGINDVVYMGDVVNRAAHLAAKGSMLFAPPLMVDGDFYGNLSDENKGLLRYDASRGCYTGEVVENGMETWYKENCQ